MNPRFLSYRTVAVVASCAAALGTADAYAQGVAKFKTNGSDKAFCTLSSSGQITVTSGGSIEISCATDVTLVDGNTPTPTTTPGPTPGPTPTPTGCEGLTPTTNFQLAATLGPAQSALVHRGVVGVVYSFPLPKNPQGQHNHGTFTHYDDPGGGAGILVETSISKCPGDTNYANSPDGIVTISGTRLAGTYKPCISTGYSASGGIRWNVIASATECKVDNTSNWYLNLRYINGCAGTCPIDYGHIEY